MYKESIKSAKAAIMSRNMSHNLGSHVMYYIKQRLNSVQKMIDSDVLRELYPNIITGNDDVAKSLERLEMPFLVGLGRFINYLQERQDYIATVATDYIPANSTISFKDFIYDELKPDLRYKRHKERNSSSTETKGHQPKNLLMDYIAYSEGYKNSDAIQLRFRDFDGENPNGEAEHKKRAADSFEALRKLDVALPGGVIGRQAFFSIIENIIRNAAKHSGRRPEGKLYIDFDVVPEAEILGTSMAVDVDKVAWWDGLQAHNEVYAGKTAEDLRDLYRAASDKYILLTITNNMPNSGKAIEGLAEGLSRQYVDQQGNMDDQCKGLKEIRISAAWMRGYSIDTDVPQNEPPVVAIRKVLFDKKEMTDKYAIQYLICLPKPKKVAFLVGADYDYEWRTEAQAEITAEARREIINRGMQRNGCRIFSPLEDNSGKDKYALSEIADYDVIVFCDPKIEDNGSLMQKLPSRIILFSEENRDELRKFVGQMSADKTLEATGIDADKASGSKADKADGIAAMIGNLYKLWFLKRYDAPGNISLSILDEKSRHQKPLEGEKMFVGDSTADAIEYYRDKVIFSTHYEGQAAEGVTEVRRALFAQARFAEGITGNNSTDRLIRQDEWTVEWMYKNLAAGMSRIAIFDERIFSAITPQMQSQDEDLVQIEELLDGYFEKRLEMPAEKAGIVLFKVVEPVLRNQHSRDLIRGAVLKVEASGLLSADWSEQVRREIAKIIDGELHPRNYQKTQRFHEKRVWAYDVIPHRDEKYVEILGYNAPIDDRLGVYNPEYRVCRVGKINMDGEAYKVEMEPYIGSNKFDFISIHQGILDKIYSAFGITQEQEKLKVTHALHSALSSCTVAENADPGDYLPQFIIHSGRSKPNGHDMPQKQPFIQFSAIDHAVRDCKYTLSELLLSAHYEGDSTNP